MRRVDLIGASGVGKTSVRIGLMQVREQSDQWLSARRTRPTGQGPPRDGWRRFRRECELILGEVQDYSDDFAVHLFEKIDHAEAAELSNDPSWLVFDESLSQRGVYVQLRAEPGRHVVQRFWNLMPLPALVVYLRAAPETVARRLHGRAKVAGLHRNLVPAQIDAMTRRSIGLLSFGVDLMAQHGATVFSVDAEGDEKATIHEVASLLRRVEQSDRLS